MAMRAKRTKKVKYIKLYSPFLMKETKHELIGEPMESEAGRRQWARCTVSRHSQLIDLDKLEAEESRVSAVVPASKEDARLYSPKEEYDIGNVILHKTWDDVGIVISKDITSNGGFAIVVQFEKNKEKRLIERMK